MCDNCNNNKIFEQVQNSAFATLQNALISVNTYYLEHKDEIKREIKKEQRRLRYMQRSRPNIERGDIVRIDTVHSAELLCYQVDGYEDGGVFSNPAHFYHRYDEIVAIYRYDGNDYKCIWERADYKRKKEMANDTSPQKC